MASSSVPSFAPWLLLSSLALGTACDSHGQQQPGQLVAEPPLAVAPSHARPSAVPAELPLVEPDHEPDRADTDPHNDELVAPPDLIDDCEARLTAAGVKFARAELPLRTRANAHACGTPQAVVYRSGPGRIRYNGPPVVSCGLGLALSRLELLLQEEAQSRFGKRVVRIEQGGTYSCRKMSRFTQMVSEHSYANAIDLRSFTLEDGRRISVQRHFGEVGAEPKDTRATFLRSIARRSFDEDLFSVVLTPYFDKLHADHFHLDLARYRVDGTR